MFFITLQVKVFNIGYAHRQTDRQTNIPTDTTETITTTFLGW